MDISRFLSIAKQFTDDDSEYVYEKGHLALQIRGDLIEARVIDEGGSVLIDDGTSSPTPAYAWIRDSLAKVELLANSIAQRTSVPDSFVTPYGDFLDTYAGNQSGKPEFSENCIEDLTTALDRNDAGLSQFIYLTSDAGEGKTTLIDKIARERAQAFIEGDRGWLLVPIRLGGRPFMSLDDITTAELNNRWRFMAFYGAYLELVKLRILVPALDGFEEVLVESASRDGISALGELANRLDGNGNVLVAARKSYFEINSISSQSRFFSTLSEDAAVEIAQLQIRRWSKEQFLEYCEKTGLSGGESLYKRVCERFSEDHPLLTRAVLVNQLVKLALDVKEDELLARLGESPEDYFTSFVAQIIDREATEKWIDTKRGGDRKDQILSTDQHFDLLTSIANEMWLSKKSAIKSDYLEAIAEVFAEEQSLGPGATELLIEKLSDHALLSYNPQTSNISFDHDDFREYFTGLALSNVLATYNKPDLESFLNKAAVPVATIDASVKKLTSAQHDLDSLVETLVAIGERAPATSYTKENCAYILILLSENITRQVTVSKLTFPPNCLSGKQVSNVTFKDCFFRSTRIRPDDVDELTFENCEFEHLKIDGGSNFKSVDLLDSKIHALELEESIIEYDPTEISRLLASLGFRFKKTQNDGGDKDVPSEAVQVAMQAFRVFLRTTHANDNIFKQKLGVRYNFFESEVLEKLLQNDILMPVKFKGAGTQQGRYKLNVPMKRVEASIKKKFSNIDSLITYLKTGRK